MKITIAIEPMGAVRTTRAMAGRTESGRRYALYKHRIGRAIAQAMPQPASGAIGVPLMVFKMPIPKSSRGIKPGDLHTKKPDIDNLIKGLFDAANGIAWVDDNRVASIGSVQKIYSDEPGIEFIVETVGPLSKGQK